MAVRFTPPRYQVLDGNGKPRVGAKLYTYLTETDTPLPVYADNERTTPHANPVVADANGAFPAVFLADRVYKMVLKTAADVTIYTDDPVDGTDGLENFGELRPQDFGAQADGVTDDSAAIQRTFDAAAGRSVYFSEGIYYVGSQVSYLAGASNTAGLKIRGDGPQKSIWRCRVPGAAALKLGLTAPYVFQYSGWIKDLGFAQDDSYTVANQDCWSLEGVFGFTFERNFIERFTGGGIVLPQPTLTTAITGFTLSTSTTVVTTAQSVFNVTDGETVTGTGIPAGTTVVTTIRGTTSSIQLSEKPTVNASGVTLSFGGNPDGNASPFNLFRQNEVLRNNGGGLVDLTSNGFVYPIFEQNSFIQNGREFGVPQFRYQSGGIRFHRNRVGGGSDGGRDTHGPGLHWDNPTQTVAVLDITSNEFDSNWGGHVQVRRGNNGKVEANRFISHQWEETENMRSPLGVNVANTIDVGACATTSGSATLTNSHTVANVTTTSGSNTITTSGTFATVNTGDVLSGTGIKTGSVVATKTGTQTITMSRKASASGTITLTAVHPFAALGIVEGDEVALDPIVVSLCSITEGSPTVTTAESFASVSMGDLATGFNIPTGTTVLSVSGNSLTLSNNATLTRTGTQVMRFQAPGIPLGTTVSTITADGTLTMSANATLTLSAQTVRFGRILGVTKNLEFKRNIVRTDALAGEDQLAYPYTAYRFGGSALGAHRVFDTEYGTATAAITKYDIPANAPVEVAENGLTIRGVGTTPYAAGREVNGDQILLASTATTVLLDSELLDRSSSFGTTGIDAFKTMVPIEGITTDGDTTIVAAAMTLKSSFSASNGGTTVTMASFNVGSGTTNGTTTVTSSNNFATAGVKVGMAVSGTDIPELSTGIPNRVVAVSGTTITILKAASGSTAGTATLTFIYEDLRRIVLPGATVEHANIPAGTKVNAVTSATTFTLTAPTTGALTAADLDFYNLTGLVDGDLLTNYTGSNVAANATTTIVGTPTKTAATLSAAAASSTSGVTLMSGGYKIPSTGLYLIGYAGQIDNLAENDRVLVSINKGSGAGWAEENLAGGGGTATNTVRALACLLCSEGDGITVQVRQFNAAAKRLIAGSTVSNFFVIPMP